MPSMAGPILFLDCGAVGQGRLVNELQDPDSSDAVRPLADLDLVTLHEANLTLNESIVKMWRERGFRGRVLNAGGRFGNTTSASIPGPNVRVGSSPAG